MAMNQSHDTVVIGQDKDGKVVWLKSYDYLGDQSQAAQAQSDLKFVQETFPEWRICAIECLKLNDD